MGNKFYHWEKFSTGKNIVSLEKKWDNFILLLSVLCSRKVNVNTCLLGTYLKVEFKVNL